MLEKGFEEIIGEDLIDYSSAFARRAMADLAFTDIDGNYYIVDIKTHRLDTHFNMPNLTSVERLSRFYEDDKNHFAVLAIAYSVVNNTTIKAEKIYFVPIEFLDWKCLTLGALGWGQIQIANSNHILIDEYGSRKKWMVNLCNVLFEFYDKEVGKIGNRVEYFKKVRAKWLKKKN